MLYCNSEHQAADWDNHWLYEVIKLRVYNLKRAEQDLRVLEEQEQPSTDSEHDAYQLSLECRHRLIDGLGKIRTVRAVEASLKHALHFIHLEVYCFKGLQHRIPPLFLRLGRDQGCYDYIKWFHYRGYRVDYIKNANANALESVEYMCSSRHVSHVSAMTLLKIKLLLDVRSLKNSTILGTRLPLEILQNVQRYIPQSMIISNDKKIMYLSNFDSLLEELISQVVLLYKTVSEANKYMWRALLEAEDHRDKEPEDYVSDHMRDILPMVQWSMDAWLETPGALELIRALVNEELCEEE